MAKKPDIKISLPLALSDELFYFHRLNPEAHIPTKANENAVGYDLYAFSISETGRALSALIPPHFTRMISTKLVLRPPAGFYFIICSRSGLANQSIFIANAPGIIDPDYSGEIKILLYNGSDKSYQVQHNDRIAQAILMPVPPAYSPIEMAELPEPIGRGEAGFGSTGR